MNEGRAVFSQLISFLPDREFRRCVERYRGDVRLRGFSCWDQYLAMAFVQLTYRESLRDIEACLRSMQGKLHHLGFRGKVARSTLADANESHDWRIFADFAQVLIGIARPLYAPTRLASTWIKVCMLWIRPLSICACRCFPWAKFRRRKAAVKMHTLLDLHGNIPTFIRVTSGDVHDVNILDEIMPKQVPSTSWTGAISIFRGSSSSHSVLRSLSCAPSRTCFIQRRYSHSVDKNTGVRSDQTVILTSFESASAYPDALRRVSYFDAETNKRLKFLTNACQNQQMGTV
jgi:Domain of unknown function (DUF4372)